MGESTGRRRDDGDETDRRAYRVAYDGRAYHGFQRQPDVPTVEDALLDALRALDVCPGDGTPPGWAAAGRTDAGVSALAQTVAFDAPAWLSPAAFTSELPADVWVWADAAAPADFHATHDATSRAYTYHLHAPADEVDDARARGTLAELAGEHDFHNLTPDDEGTVRDLETDLEREGEFLRLRLRASGFPRQLVRRVVSLVAEFGRGTPSGDRLERVLSPEPLSGPEGVPPAPAEPLVLTEVSYSVSFEGNNRVLSEAREWFEARRVEGATLARVSATIGSSLPE
ncbi:tRNA pseudouridine(38-40) synthase TruA [Salinirussus salinus]|uniref:tRNA pseudouridine(38-40) synthase TruA n=1 Tax=Salinirussus salinus TaxID=1198300 RepID=UPI00135C59FE|nr:tRNA pseudouridine(38-40) synthase TruA [Salinirussus salinus]